MLPLLWKYHYDYLNNTISFSYSGIPSTQLLYILSLCSPLAWNVSMKLKDYPVTQTPGVPTLETSDQMNSVLLLCLFSAVR